MAKNASTSGEVVGVVKGINGVVTAVKSDGTTRTLHQGDAVFKDEVIKSSNGATVHIDFNQGGFATLGSGQSLPLDGSLLSSAAGAAKPDAAAPTTPATPEDVAKQQELIAEAIARGEDPTALLEAAAAGAAGGAAGGNEGGSFVVVQQNAARGEVTPGFETGTFSTPLNEIYEYSGRFNVPEFSFTDENGIRVDALQITVHEDGLADIGSRRADGGPHPTGGEGSFLIDTHHEGLFGLTISGTDVMGALNGGGSVSVTIPGFPGTFTITDIKEGANGVYTVEYTYELTGPYQNAPGEDHHDFNFTVTATDNLGQNQTSQNANIRVMDDNPIAADDVRFMDETGLSNNIIDGNVVSGTGNEGGTDTGKDTSGADGVDHVTWGTGSSVGGNYTMVETGTGKFNVMEGTNLVGSIELGDQGAYKFTLDPNYDVSINTTPPSIEIPYTVHDTDGDTADAKLIINLEPNSATPDLTLAGVIVHEDALPQGSVGSGIGGHPASASSTIVISTNENLKTISIAGHTYDAGTELGTGDSNGIFTLSASNKQIFVDANGVEVAGGAGDPNCVGYLTIDSISKVSSGYEVKYTFTLTGNIKSDNSNADNIDTNNASGKDQSGFDTITVAVSAKDQTNDTVQGEFNIKVMDDVPVAKDDVIYLRETGEIAITTGNVVDGVNGAGKDTFGADGKTAEGSFKWGTVPDEVAHKVEVGGVEKGQYSLVQVGSVGQDGSSTYTLKDGNKELGTLKLEADGKYTFTLNAGYTLEKGEITSIKIPYTITDGDGDTATADLTINLRGDSTATTITGGDVNVHEDGLTQGGVRGADAPAGSNPGHATKVPGTTTIKTTELLDEVTIKGITFTANTNGATGLSNGQFTVPDTKIYVNAQGNTVSANDTSCIGYLEISSIARASNGTQYDIKYNFVLMDNAKHTTAATGADSNTDQSVKFAVDVSVIDHTGDKTDGTFKVTVLDDAPKADADTAILNESTPLIGQDDHPIVDQDGNAFVTGNVLANDKSGADGWVNGGWSDGKPNTGAQGQDTSLPGEGGEGVTGYTFKALVNGTTDITYTLDTADTPLKLGTPYTIMHDGGVVGIFELKADGSYTFTKPDGSIGLNENVTIRITYTVEDGDGDKASANLDLTLTNGKLFMYLTGDTVMYEEATYGPVHGGSGWNNSGDNSYTLANYKINWATKADGTCPTGMKSGMNYSFEVAFKSSGASYGDDVRLGVDADKNGQIDSGRYLTETNESGYLNALNAKLLADYGGTSADPNVKVTDVTWNNGNPTLHFEVKDGTVLDKPLGLTIEAIDDNLNESGEKYQLSLQNPTDIQGGGSNDITIIQDPKTNAGNAGTVNTEIIDGANTGYGSGQWLKLESANVYESTVKGGQESGSDVAIAIRLYENEVGGGLYTGREPPAEKMTLTFGFKDGTAQDHTDYQSDKNSAVVNVADWKAYDAAGLEITFGSDGAPQGVIAYWEATVTIPGLIAEDRLTEGVEDFNIFIESVRGNESAPVYTDVNKIGNKDANGSDATITITDDDKNHPGNLVDGEHYKDGPKLDAFFLVNDKLVEPVAPNVHGDGRPNNVEPTTGEYKIILDSVASEDVIITLKLGGGAALGADYNLITSHTGEGLMTFAQLTKYYADKGGVPSYFVESPDSYYVIVKQGSATASFGVEILHDHDSASKSDGQDLDSNPENIVWEITGMDGSESQWNENDAKNTLDKPIYDDGQGPTIVFGDDLNVTFIHSDPTGAAYGDITGSIKQSGAPVAMGEDVTVTISVYGNDGKVYQYSFDMPATGESVDLSSLNNGAGLNLSMFKENGTGSAPPSHLSYGYVRIDSTVGGETRHNNDFQNFHQDEGTVPHLHITEVKGTAIHEVNPANPSDPNKGEPTSTTYTLHISGSTTTEAAFVIKAYDNTTSLTDFDGTRDVKVTLGADLLKELGKNITEFDLKVSPDADGNPQLSLIIEGKTYEWNGSDEFVNVSDPTDTFNGTGTKLEGHLPTAKDDNIVEGDESFSPIITDSTGNVHSVAPVEDVKIIDNDKPVLKVSFGHVDGVDFIPDTHVTEGDMKAANNSDYVVRVSLEDVAGGTLVNGTGPIVVELTLTGTAVDGQDIVLYKTQVTIEPGQSLADVKVIFPNDFISDGNKNFTVDATIVSGGSHITETVYGEELQNNGVTITDLPDGPNVSIVHKGGDVTESGTGEKTSREDGSATILVKLDKAVEENATVKLKFAFDEVSDSANGMTPDDVKSLTIAGKTYNVADIDWDTGKVTSSDGTTTLNITKTDGAKGTTSWVIDVPLDKGTSGTTVSVNFNDDYVSEKPETLHVDIIGVDKGELQFGDNTGLDITVTEHINGPQVYLSAEKPIVDEDTAAVFNLNIKDEVPETFTATFKLADGWKDILQAEGGQYSVDYNGKSYAINPDGTFTVTIEKGTSAGDGKLSFALAGDNSQTQVDRNLGLALESLSGGEATIAGAPGFTQVLSSQDGAGSNYAIDADSAFKSNATVKYVLNGLSVDKADYTNVSVGGTAYTLKLDGNGKYYVEVKYKAGDTVDTTIRVETTSGDGNYTRDINITTNVELGAVVTITDEKLAINREGPEFTITDTADAAVEGGTYKFALSAVLPADTASELANQVSIKITLSVNNLQVDAGNASAFTVRIGGVDYPATYLNGVLTVTIPKGTSVTDLSDMTVSVPLKDNAIADQSSITAKITSMTQDTSAGAHVYEDLKYDPANIISKNVDNSSTDSGPVISLKTVQTDVAEGATLTVTVKDNGVLAADGASTSTITVKVLIDNLPPGSIVSSNAKPVANEPGYYTVELTKGQSAKEITIKVPYDPATNDYSSKPITVTITEVGSNSDGRFEKDAVIDDANKTISVPVKDVGAGFNLDINATAGTQDIAYVIGLAAVGDYFNNSNHSTIEKAISFNLELDNMSAAQMQSIADQLSAQANVAATYNAAGHIEVTLSSGYTHGTDLQFKVDYELGTPNQDATQSVTITDTVSDLGHIGVVNGTDSVSHHVISGTDGSDTISHQGNDDVIIYGGDGADRLIGGSGNDIISGGDGDDLIMGGGGDDILVGGGGHDTFFYGADDLSNVVQGDTIMDFHIGGKSDPDADILDISDLLDGSGRASDGTDLLSGGYLSLGVVDDGNGKLTVTVGIDRDGTGADANAYQSEQLATIHMDGINFATGSSPDTMAQDLLNQLIANDQIKF